MIYDLHLIKNDVATNNYYNLKSKNEVTCFQLLSSVASLIIKWQQNEEGQKSTTYVRVDK